MKEVGGLSGSMRTGVTVLEGAKVFMETSGQVEVIVQPPANDMRMPAQVGTGAQLNQDGPLQLGEEEYTAAAIAAVLDGNAEQTDEDAAAPVGNAPPDSPAAAASARQRSSRRVAMQPADSDD